MLFSYKCSLGAPLVLAGIVLLTGCGQTGSNPAVPVAGATASAPSSTPTASGISPKKFANAVHAVMMADRTVYAQKIVNRLKEQAAPVKPSEYWEDEKHTIPLPAQMFRMGSEIVSNNPEAGFSYALKSMWPLNPQNKPASPMEEEGLKYVAEHKGENFYGEEKIEGTTFYTAVYADIAVAKACWDCHNNHANRTESFPTFKDGDVMGGVVVRIPLD